jgi:hypothetical protein
LFVGGLASFTFGCYMIYRPLGSIVGGTLIIALSLLMAGEPEDLSNKRPSDR